MRRLELRDCPREDTERESRGKQEVQPEEFEMFLRRKMEAEKSESQRGSD